MPYVSFIRAKGVMNALTLLYMLLTPGYDPPTPHNWLGWQRLAGREMFYCLRLADPKVNISGEHAAVAHMALRYCPLGVVSVAYIRLLIVTSYYFLHQPQHRHPAPHFFFPLRARRRLLKPIPSFIS